MCIGVGGAHIKASKDEEDKVVEKRKEDEKLRRGSMSNYEFVTAAVLVRAPPASGGDLTRESGDLGALCSVANRPACARSALSVGA